MCNITGNNEVNFCKKFKAFHIFTKFLLLTELLVFVLIQVTVNVPLVWIICTRTSTGILTQPNSRTVGWLKENQLQHHCIYRLSKDLKSWKCSMACQIYVNTSSLCMNANMNSFSHILVSHLSCVFLNIHCT